jgi:hypothetical protein
MPIDQSEWQAKGDYMTDFEWAIQTLEYNKPEAYNPDEITAIVFECNLNDNNKIDEKAIWSSNIDSEDANEFEIGLNLNKLFRRKRYCNLILDYLCFDEDESVEFGFDSEGDIYYRFVQPD